MAKKRRECTRCGIAFTTESKTAICHRHKKRKSYRPPTRAQLLEALRIAFSLYIRNRDRTCLMGQKLGGCQGPLQAGHLISARKLPTKFDPMNVFGQCSYHNFRHSNGDPHSYVQWFVETHGYDAYAALLDKSRQPDPYVDQGRLIALLHEFKGHWPVSEEPTRIELEAIIRSVRGGKKGDGGGPAELPESDSGATVGRQGAL